MSVTFYLENYLTSFMEQCEAFPGVGLRHPLNWKEAKGQNSEGLLKIQVEISLRPLTVCIHSCSQVFKIPS